MKHAILLDVLHAAHELEHLCRDRFGVLPADVFEQHHELVTAEARDEILRAHAVADLPSRELQQVVACHVTASVVHVLELIEVDKEQRAAALAAHAARNLGLELRDQPVTVVKPRERVEIREMHEMLHALAQCTDRVFERGHDRAELGVPRDRELDLRIARGELCERLLKIRQRRKRAAQEQRAGGPRHAEQQQ